jgi:hypothetical protein
MSKMSKARTTTIIQDGGAKKWSKPKRKRIVFPVEIRYVEPKVKNG